VAFGVTGVTEVSELVKAGKLRALAVTGGQRVPGLDVPTLKESGLDVEFINWRGLVAAPGLSAADQRTLTDFAKQVTRTPAWKQALQKNQWTASPLFGDEYTSFVKAESGRVAQIMTELGVAS
jgi:putative tricarboxylic transport membrane protein